MPLNCVSTIWKTFVLRVFHKPTRFPFTQSQRSQSVRMPGLPFLFIYINVYYKALMPIQFKEYSLDTTNWVKIC